MTPIACPHCARTFAPKPELIGKTIRCPGCKQPFQVSAPAADLVPPQEDEELRLAPEPRSAPLGSASNPYGAPSNPYLHRPQMPPPQPKNLFWERWKERQKVKGIMLLILMAIFGVPLMCLCSLGILANLVAPPQDRHQPNVPPPMLKAPLKSNRAGP
jgi:hypothetical protein